MLLSQDPRVRLPECRSFLATYLWDPGQGPLAPCASVFPSIKLPQCSHL